MKQPVCILVVDDNRDMLKTFALILKRKGYFVDTAEDGIQAMEKFTSRHFDLVLMDVIMPHRNGIETMRLMRENDPDARIILMTAYCEEDQLAGVSLNGAYKALYKPVDIAKLMELIGEVTQDPSILIVDDDDDFRFSMSRMLELHNYNVVTAVSGEDALKVARNKKVQLAFVDIKMKEMDGLATSLKLKDINPNIQIVLMTGYRDEVKSLIEAAIQNGALKCLYKPFSVADLRELVNQVV
jgi:two-component system, response regulator, stage 0 sporulation protein F